MLPYGLIVSMAVILISSQALEKLGVGRFMVRLCTAMVLVIGGIVFLTGANDTAVEMYRVVVSSPDGAFSTPSGIARLCASVRESLHGQTIQVTILITFLYLILQTFCIPGTIVLNAVSGALLGLQHALPLCVVLGTVGASCCFGLSSVAGSKLADAVDRRLMQGRGVPKLRAQVVRFRSELLAYLLFLRLTPILPNWLINLASPIVGVPLTHFALATFIGITPQTYLSVRFGTIVQAHSLGSIVTMSDTLLIAMVGLAVLAASRLKKRFMNAPSTTPDPAVL